MNNTLNLIKLRKMSSINILFPKVATEKCFTLFKIIKPPFIMEASNLSDLRYGKLLNQIGSLRPFYTFFLTILLEKYINTIYGICQVLESQYVVFLDA